MSDIRSPSSRIVHGSVWDAPKTCNATVGLAGICAANLVIDIIEVDIERSNAKNLCRRRSKSGHIVFGCEFGLRFFETNFEFRLVVVAGIQATDVAESSGEGSEVAKREERFTDGGDEVFVAGVAVAERANGDLGPSLGENATELNFG